MNKDEYIKNVVIPDKEWYSKFAKRYRILHILSRILVIALSAFTAFLAGLTFSFKDVTIAAFSGMVVVITAISELMKFKEQWTEYRSTAELMKKEINLFETSTSPYNINDSFNLFVQNLENLKEQEHKKWRSYTTEK
jgi:Protein of unknown function (DUF4231)